MTKSIDLATNIGCRVQCKFCPQDVSMSNYATKYDIEPINFGNPSQMSFSTFVKILKTIPKHYAVIHLKGHGTLPLSQLEPESL